MGDRQDVFFDVVEGAKEYQKQLKLAQPGEYKVIATASFQGKVVDTDEYSLAVEGTEQTDHTLTLLVFVSVAIVLGYLYYHGRHHVRKAEGYATGVIASNKVKLKRMTML